MNLEILEKYSDMKLELHKRDLEIEILQEHIIELKENTVQKDLIKDMFDVYGFSAYVKEDIKIGLVKWLNGETNEFPQIKKEI